MKDAFANVLNKVKDGYFWLVDWVDANPQKALWIATALIVGALVL